MKVAVVIRSRVGSGGKRQVPEIEVSAAEGTEAEMTAAADKLTELFTKLASGTAAGTDEGGKS